MRRRTQPLALPAGRWRVCLPSLIGRDHNRPGPTRRRVDDLALAQRAAAAIVAVDDLMWEPWSWARMTGWRAMSGDRPVAFIIDTEAEAA